MIATRETIKQKIAAAQRQLNWAIKSEAVPRIAAMLRLAQSELAVTPGQFDGNPMLLTCPNGTIDLESGRLREHRRQDFITKLCPTPFDQAAQCPQWTQFLSSIFPPKVAGYMKRFLGDCATGDIREQIFTCLWGDGSNGKSVLLETMQFVLGEDYAGKAPDGLLMARDGEQHPTEVASLFGKRLVVATETKEGARLNESRVKALTGGDKITARRMREDFWEFHPTHKLIVCSNHKPKITGQDHGIWRRVRLIPFLVRFWDADTAPKHGEDRDPKFRADKLLLGKLKAEAPGILAWLVEGCLEWQRDGLRPPAEIGAATEKYRAEEDVVQQFVEEFCDLANDPEMKIRASELYSAFRKWAESSGERTGHGQKAFTQRIEQLTEFPVKRNNGSWYCGIRLRRDEPGSVIPE